VKLKNLYKAIIGQGPFKRFIRNFFITGNAWGLFHKNSHISASTGKPKVMYNTKVSAEKASEAMIKKTGEYFSNYKCVFCDGYHIGKNKKGENK